MCPSGATSLYAHCCFSELALSFQLSMLVWYKADLIIILFKISCFRHDIAGKLLSWRYTTITHSLFQSFSLESLPYLWIFNPLLERNHTSVCRTVLNMYGDEIPPPYGYLISKVNIIYSSLPTHTRTIFDKIHKRSLQ
jgi:hypothetical protein